MTAPGETIVLITCNGYKTMVGLEGRLEPTFHIAADLDEFLVVLGS